MKVSKRSLIVSIAVLCVCALSLTAASFAWFSTSNVADVNNIQLNVAAASDLQISFDNADWQTHLNFADLLEDGQKAYIADVSTDDAINFWEPADREAVDIDFGTLPADATYAKVNNTDGAVVSFNVYFRSQSEVFVNFKGSEMNVDMNSKSGIKNALRMAVKTDDTTTFYANTAASSDAVIGGTDTAADSTVTLLGIVAGKDSLLQLSASNDGYCYGYATFVFYIEGTDEAAINANTGVCIKDLALTFTGVAPTV